MDARGVRFADSMSLGPWRRRGPDQRHSFAVLVRDDGEGRLKLFPRYEPSKTALSCAY